MSLRRPRSLSGLLLIGFTLVTVPLLIAVVNATIEMRHLTQQSELLVRHGIQATRHAQELFRHTASLERTARLYEVLGDQTLKGVLADHHRDYQVTLESLRKLVADPATVLKLSELAAAGSELAGAIERDDPKDPALHTLIESFGRQNEKVEMVANQTTADIYGELKRLQENASRTQTELFWQAAALVPVTAFILMVFVSLLVRPIRQIDQAISELGRGTFSRPVSVRGPKDLERLGRQLEWLRVRLLDLATEKNRFLRHISHELKTPLANIREGTELMMEGAVGPLDANQHEVVTILRENGIKLQRMIENLLSFSAWQAKSVGLELSAFALQPLVRSVVDAQALTLAAHRVEVDLKVQNVEVTADRGKLRLILDNLLSNAVKFTPDGGTISIHALISRGQLLLDVADTGPGIPAEDRARVFEAFYTGKARQGGHVRGTGIGLSVVMEFVQAHGGTIELVDGMHAGAHFRIRLPVRANAVAEAANAA